MVTIVCDICDKKIVNAGKQLQEWILGYDLQFEAKSGLQHSVRFLDRWDDRRILELGAVQPVVMAEDAEAVLAAIPDVPDERALLE